MSASTTQPYLPRWRSLASRRLASRPPRPARYPQLVSYPLSHGERDGYPKFLMLLFPHATRHTPRRRLRSQAIAAPSCWLPRLLVRRPPFLPLTRPDSVHGQCRYLLRPTGFSVYAYTMSFSFPSFIVPTLDTSGWLVLVSAGTSIPQEAPSFAWRTGGSDE
jgi:hypothetical protein